MYTRVNRDHDRPMRERGQVVVDEIRRISFMCVVFHGYIFS